MEERNLKLRPDDHLMHRRGGKNPHYMKISVYLAVTNGE